MDKKKHESGELKHKKQEKKKKLSASCPLLTNYFSSQSSSTSVSQHNPEDEGTEMDHDANVSDRRARTSVVVDLTTDIEASSSSNSTHQSTLKDQQQPSTSATPTLQPEEPPATEDSNVLSVAAMVLLPLPETHPPLTAQDQAWLAATSMWMSYRRTSRSLQ